MSVLMVDSLAADNLRAQTLAAEESKFAAYSVQHGMRDAFVEFFADDSILLRPDPVNGREFMRTQNNPPVVLDWKSQIAIVAGSGELGLSTGPWKATSQTDPVEPPTFGQFFSVWQKQKDGDWKVLIDHGISHGNSASPERALVARDLPSPGGRTDRMAGGEPEKDFIAVTLTHGTADAYRQAVGNNTRLLRNERAPIDGTQAIGGYLKSIAGKWDWQPTRQALSASRDFAYALGRWSHRAPSGLISQGNYVRVWIRDATLQPTRWVLAAEVLTPRPAPRN
jgi:ketosteroid isomerase-like protein